jgi:hypothetical protein
MDGFEITLDNSESMNIGAYLKYPESSRQHRIHVWLENENCLSVSFPCRSGRYDDLQISVTPGGIKIRSPHEIKVETGNNGQQAKVDIT